MALKIPTVKEATEQNVTTFESELNQTVPLTTQAFLRVLSFIQAGSQTQLYKYGAERSLQNFALTATEIDLDRIGNEYGVARKVAVAAVLDIQIVATTGTIIGPTNSYIGDSNGVRYIPDAQGTAVDDLLDLTVTAQVTGVVGNLSVGATLTIESPVAGASSKATVTAVDTLGTERELDDSYRERILSEIRTVGGGGNAVDYRTWAEQTPGVRRAYPYAGRPSGTSYPGERTVYIEAETSLDPDGIADQNLLDAARDYIDHDPDTEQTRTPLGLPNLDEETLWVESISRTGIYIEIRNLTVDVDVEAQLKSDIEDSLSVYFRALGPFVDGVDVEIERDDSITSISIATIVQSLFVQYGAYASGIGFGTSIGVFIDFYQLNPGEKAKLEQITYITT